MAILKSWMLKMSKKKSSKRSKKLDIIAMAVLHLRLCDPEEAQATLASLAKVKGVRLCDCRGWYLVI